MNPSGFFGHVGSELEEICARDICREKNVTHTVFDMTLTDRPCIDELRKTSSTGNTVVITDNLGRITAYTDIFSRGSDSVVLLEVDGVTDGMEGSYNACISTSKRRLPEVICSLQDPKFLSQILGYSGRMVELTPNYSKTESESIRRDNIYQLLLHEFRNNSSGFRGYIVRQIKNNNLKENQVSLLKSLDRMMETMEREFDPSNPSYKGLSSDYLRAVVGNALKDRLDELLPLMNQLDFIRDESKLVVVDKMKYKLGKLASKAELLSRENLPDSFEEMLNHKNGHQMGIIMAEHIINQPFSNGTVDNFNKTFLDYVTSGNPAYYSDRIHCFEYVNPLENPRRIEQYVQILNDIESKLGTEGLTLVTGMIAKVRINDPTQRYQQYFIPFVFDLLDKIRDYSADDQLSLMKKCIGEVDEKSNALQGTNSNPFLDKARNYGIMQGVVSGEQNMTPDVDNTTFNYSLMPSQTYVSGR